MTQATKTRKAAPAKAAKAAAPAAPATAAPAVGEVLVDVVIPWERETKTTQVYKGEDEFLRSAIYVDQAAGGAARKVRVTVTVVE